MFSALSTRLRHVPRFRTLIPTALVTVSAPACAGDMVSPTVTAYQQTARHSLGDVTEPIIVRTPAELVSALQPINSGRRIVVRSGTYEVTQPLVVPDGAVLEGDGDMQFDDEGLPTGFSAGSRTTITMTANVPGDLITLGNASTIRRLAVQDLTGRQGNVLSVASRTVGDEIEASIAEMELLSGTAHGVVPAGPVGCAITVLSRNLNLGAPPAPHSGAVVSARVTGTLMRAPAAGVGCGVFAFNFAPEARVSVTLAGNVVGGGLLAAGGVSRPDEVHHSLTTVTSRRNLYRADAVDACTVRRLGWNLQGGSGTPVNIPNPGAHHNVLRVVSHDDRLEGFTTGIAGAGGRRFFGAPSTGPVNDNTLELQLLGTHISTPSCGGAAFVADMRLSGAQVGNGSLIPGDGNTTRVVMRQVTGSGARFNAFADVLGPTGIQPEALQGTGNRLLFMGNAMAFGRTNRNVTPGPSASFFTGDNE